MKKALLGAAILTVTLGATVALPASNNPGTNTSATSAAVTQDQADALLFQISQQVDQADINRSDSTGQGQAGDQATPPYLQEYDSGLSDYADGNYSQAVEHWKKAQAMIRQANSAHPGSPGN